MAAPEWPESFAGVRLRPAADDEMVWAAITGSDADYWFARAPPPAGSVPPPPDPPPWHALVHPAACHWLARGWPLTLVVDMFAYDNLVDTDAKKLAWTVLTAPHRLRSDYCYAYDNLADEDAEMLGWHVLTTAYRLRREYYRRAYREDMRRRGQKRPRPEDEEEEAAVQACPAWFAPTRRAMDTWPLPAAETQRLAAAMVRRLEATYVPSLLARGDVAVTVELPDASGTYYSFRLGGSLPPLPPAYLHAHQRRCAKRPRTDDEGPRVPPAVLEAARVPATLDVPQHWRGHHNYAAAPVWFDTPCYYTDATRAQECTFLEWRDAGADPHARGPPRVRAEQGLTRARAEQGEAATRHLRLFVRDGAVGVGTLEAALAEAGARPPGERALAAVARAGDGPVPLRLCLTLAKAHLETGRVVHRLIKKLCKAAGKDGRAEDTLTPDAMVVDRTHDTDARGRYAMTITCRAVAFPTPAHLAQFVAHWAGKCSWAGIEAYSDCWTMPGTRGAAGALEQWPLEGASQGDLMDARPTWAHTDTPLATVLPWEAALFRCPWWLGGRAEAEATVRWWPAVQLPPEQEELYQRSVALGLDADSTPAQVDAAEKALAHVLKKICDTLAPSMPDDAEDPPAAYASICRFNRFASGVGGRLTRVVAIDPRAQDARLPPTAPQSVLCAHIALTGRWELAWEGRGHEVPQGLGGMLPPAERQALQAALLLPRDLTQVPPIVPDIPDSHFDAARPPLRVNVPKLGDVIMTDDDGSDEQRVAVLIAGCGTAKSTSTRTYFDRLKRIRQQRLRRASRLLIMSGNRAHADDVHRSTGRTYKNYMHNIEQLRAKALAEGRNPDHYLVIGEDIVNVASLWHIDRSKPVDAVFVDELLTLLEALVKPVSVEHADENWLTFRWLMATAKRIIFADAYLGEELVSVIKLLCPGAKLELVHNAYMVAVGKTIYVSDSEQETTAFVLSRIKAGKRPVLVSDSVERANRLKERIMVECGLRSDEIGIYTGDTAEATKRYDMANIESVWVRYKVLIYTSTVKVGCSFDPLHYDFVVCYAGDTILLAETILQMMQRVRNTKEPIGVVCFQQCTLRDLPTSREAVLEYLRCRATAAHDTSLTPVANLTLVTKFLSPDGQRYVFPNEGTDAYLEIVIAMTRLDHLSRNDFKGRVCGLLRGMGATLAPLPQRLTLQEVVDARAAEKETRARQKAEKATLVSRAPTLTMEQANMLRSKQHFDKLDMDETRALHKHDLRCYYDMVHLDAALITPEFVQVLDKKRPRALFKKQRGLVSADTNTALLNERGEMRHDLAQAEASGVFTTFFASRYDFFQLHFANALVRAVGFKHLCDSPDFIDPGTPLGDKDWWATRLRRAGPFPQRATRIGADALLEALRRYLDPVTGTRKEWEVLQQFTRGKPAQRAPACSSGAPFKSYLQFVNALFLNGLGLTIKRERDSALSEYVLCNTMRQAFSGGDWPRLL